MDSNGDGIGDLDGIISKLDYIKDLGIETVWFSPFFKSPQKDFGYDISNYRDIAPEYGTMKTCEKLIKEMHDREMRIVLDMVLNHTSDEHPWFIASRSSKDNPKRDWYVWRDGKKPGGKAPPNNWRSMVTGSGWHHDATTGQWYWAQFLPFQPDLNYRNPEVKEEMLDTMRFWLDKGVDGFRLDIINSLFEDADFRDNPMSWRVLPSESSTDMLFQKTINTLNHPDTLAFTKVLRGTIDEFNDPPRFMVGEVSAPVPVLKQYLGENADGLNLTFQFQALGLKLKARKIEALIRTFDSHFHEPFLPTWVFSNHDRFRRISRLGGDIEKAKLNIALQLTARGVPFIYYGEEIGMEQHRISVKQAIDPMAHILDYVPQFLHDIARKVASESLNRDECRTPMQWEASPNAGFCMPDVTPWLPVTPSYRERNVAAESNDPSSLLECYKRFLAARRAIPALHEGSIKLLDKMPSSVVAYKREAIDGKYTSIVTVVLNCGKKPIRMPSTVTNATTIVSTSINPQEGTLAAWEGRVLQG